MTPPDLRLPEPELDPTVHKLTGPILDGPQGAEHFRPVTLDEAAATARDRLTSGADFDFQPNLGSRNLIAISPARARVIADLLEELSLRTRPGTEIGPIRSDGSISALARELYEYLSERV